MEVRASLELNLDVRNWTELSTAAMLSLDENWKKWEEFRDEKQEKEKTLWTLRERLHENIIQRIWREHPKMSMWATLAAGGILAVLTGGATLCAWKWHRNLRGRLRLERSAWRTQARETNYDGVEPNTVRLQLMMPTAGQRREAADDRIQEYNRQLQEVVYAPSRNRRFEI